jgi:hypothetical protein
VLCSALAQTRGLFLGSGKFARVLGNSRTKKRGFWEIQNNSQTQNPKNPEPKKWHPLHHYGAFVHLEQGYLLDFIVDDYRQSICRESIALVGCIQALEPAQAPRQSGEHLQLRRG